MTDRVAMIARLLADIAASAGKPIDPNRADADALRADFAKRYPDLTVEVVRRAIAIACEYQAKFAARQPHD